jgi:predicted RNA-binding Zn-ribbon protein involved in translation (DUF1610 family)
MPKKPAADPIKGDSRLHITSLDIDLSDKASPGNAAFGVDSECRSHTNSSGNRPHQFQPVDESRIQLCPHCGSSLINRIHRGFIRKTLLKSPPLYQCRECRKSFNIKQIAQAETSRNLRNRSNNQ